MEANTSEMTSTNDWVMNAAIAAEKLLNEQLTKKGLLKIAATRGNDCNNE